MWAMGPKCTAGQTARGGASQTGTWPEAAGEPAGRGHGPEAAGEPGGRGLGPEAALLGTSAPVRDEGSREHSGPVRQGNLGPVMIHFLLLSRPLLPPRAPPPTLFL